MATLLGVAAGVTVAPQRPAFPTGGRELQPSASDDPFAVDVLSMRSTGLPLPDPDQAISVHDRSLSTVGMAGVDHRSNAPASGGINSDGRRRHGE
jgi:hypothetical protein